MSIILPAQPEQNLQQILDTLNDFWGGGTLNLNPTGIFNLTDNLSVYSNIIIQGNGAILDFGGTANGVQLIGTDDNMITNSSLSYLTIQNTTGIGIDINYGNNPSLNILDNMLVQNCGTTGVRIQNSYAPYIVGTIQNNGVNLEMDTVNSFEIHFSGFLNSITGDGIVLNNCSSSAIIDTGVTGNFKNGIKMTNCSQIGISIYDTASNGGDGIKLVSGNSYISIGEGESFSNTGYGINIADSTSTSTILFGNNTASNTSGGLNDSGTGTLKSALVNNFS